MRSQISIISIILLVFTSCINKENNYREQFFPREESLHGDILCSDLCVNLPFDMCCINDYIALLSLKDGKLLHFYDKQSGRFVGSYVSHGNGANEYFQISDLSFDYSRRLLSFVEVNKERLIGIEVDDSLKMHKVYEQSLKGKAKVFRTAFPLNDTINLIESQAIKGSSWLQTIDSAGFVVSDYSSTLDNSLEDAVLTSQTHSVVSPSGTHYARATLFGGILQIFDVDDGKIKCRHIGRHIRPIGNVVGLSFENTPETILCYCDLFATNKYLYGVMLNTVQETNSSLVVWDWEGNPIAKWNSDKLLQHICIDPEDESILYATTVKEGSLNLERFVIPL
jgi:hypothetical protein